MKKFLTLVFSVTFIFLQAQFSDLAILPTQGSWAIHKGIIDNTEIEIIHDGHRARVELTFTVYVDSVNLHFNNYRRNLPTYKDNLLEARLNFKLAPEAFFYDSYLWLNATTIIRAKILPRGEANRVYDSIVNRKIDPSILQKNWDNQYSLKIFPISTVFPRKVKIAYSIPFKVEDNGREFIELPTDILKLTRASSTTSLIVHHKSNVKFKHLVFPLTGSIINENSTSVTFRLQNNQWVTNPSFYLEYFNENAKEPFSFYHQKLTADECFYDLRLSTKQLTNLTKSISSFGVKIPLKTGGFVYQNYNTSKGLLIPNSLYNECGSFVGEVDFEKPIELKYKIGSTIFTLSDTPKSNRTGEFLYQNWAHMFSQNVTNNETKEVSLKYRVLNNQTAFLALEDGDTVTSTKGNDMISNGGRVRSGIFSADKEAISVYPNPIIKDFKIESETPIISLRIIDISGRLVFSQEFEKGTKTLEFNSEELKMKSGIYWLIIEEKSKMHTIKVLKE